VRINDIKNILRKDTPIYYRRIYSGLAEIVILEKKQALNIDWVIETSPLGTKTITVTVRDKIDYPLLNIIKELKLKIGNFDEEGKLPL